MKKIISLILSAVLFTGCFSGEEEPVVDLTSYNTDLFSINKPTDWQILGVGDFTSNISDQILVAFRNNVRNETFIANLSVSATKLNSGVTVSDFTTSQRAQLRATLIGYLESGVSQTTISSGNIELPAEILSFQGKRKAQDPLLQFKQLTVVRDGVGYLVVAAYLPDESPSTIDYLDGMISSFHLN